MTTPGGGMLSWPMRWWRRQSLRARLTLLATALFTMAVAVGAVLLIVLQRYALTHVLDSAAEKNARDIAHRVESGKIPTTVLPTTGGVAAVQVVNRADQVVGASPGTDRITPLVNAAELVRLRAGAKMDIANPTSDGRLRVLGHKAGSYTVVVATDLSRVDDSQEVLTRAALIGSPLAVLLMGLATYAAVGLTLRPVAALRHGAADITAAGLADQRLPVGAAQDEIHRLAVTLNAMLDRIDAATARQRTFVGDAAHELRSPLASLRVQLEIAQRLGPEAGWDQQVDDVMVDVDRLDRLVADLLALARMDESRQVTRDPVDLAELVTTVVAGYRHARVPVHAAVDPGTTVTGDPDGLRRVVINLIDNAVRYARGGVDVELHRGSLAGRAVIRLTVTDDGPGIAPDERERVFDRFYRVQHARDRDTGGTGLGLPIVRDLVRAHGGSVRLSDRTDGEPGLRAVVLIPLTEP